MDSRREFLTRIAAMSAAAGSVVGVGLPAQARAGPLISLQRRLSMEMADAFALNGDRGAFRRLFDVQTAFLGLSWPAVPLVVTDAMSALRRVLDGQVVQRAGYRRVVRRPLRDVRYVVFSDHHILPDTHRQSDVWRANRAAYTSLLGHYGEQGWVVVENGDVEDLVILEPDRTVAMYDALISTRGNRNPRRLIEWYRDEPAVVIDALREGRRHNRRNQLAQILETDANQPYYRMLEALARSGQLVRLAGNHDYDLQDIDGCPAHLVPHDILVLGGDRPSYALMHGHQFDQATHPGVAPLYGEVVSECLGVWYQGPDRSWSRTQARRILAGGFPNRLATHKGSHRGGGLSSRFLRALLAAAAYDDEEWADAWEGLFGHPIAWEYGARDWSSAVQGHFARPGDLVDDAMAGRQFFKFRHLDEWEIVRGLSAWDIDVGLVLGHSHEVRYQLAGGGSRYFNSGAAGRFVGLVWALEIGSADDVQVVGWFVDGAERVERVLFEPVETTLFSYFEPRRPGTYIGVEGP